MEILVKDDVNLTRLLTYYSKNDFTKEFFNTRLNIKFMFIFAVIMFFFLPLVSFFLLSATFIYFNYSFVRKFLNSKKLILKYKDLFSPKLDEVSISVIGYKVEPEELQEHLLTLKDKEALAEKQKRMEKIKSRWVGLGLDTLKTHLIIVGKTGSGKTEFIRSLQNDIWKNGGGSINNDGKSDEKMLLEFANQLKALGRETSLRVVNYLKAEYMAETNTLNPIGIMTPLRAVEFMASLISNDAQADATHKYFQQRGKAVLAPPIVGLTIRRDFYGESFDFERIRNSISISNLVILYMLFYAMSKDIEEELKENIKIQKILSIFSIKSGSEFSLIESLIEYVMQNPLEKNYIEEALSFQFGDLVKIYSYTKEGLKLYLKEVWSGYDKYLDIIAKFVYYAGKIKNYTFFSFNEVNRGITIDIFLQHYYATKDIFNENKQDAYNQIKYEILKYEKWKEYYYGLIKTGWTREKAKGGNIEEIPEDASMQHQYAVQQWTTLFNVFTMFRHIFGQTKSEINPKDLLLDNQILYNLIPVSELGDEIVQIIGKISLALIDEVASIALMGQKISVHNTLKNISKDKNTPKPIYLTFLDEYNSYPIAGVDKKLLQYRSLNISVLLGIQNLAGLKVGGTDETSKENALSNATKYFLETQDNKVIEWLNTMLREEEVLEGDFMKNWDETYIKNDTGLKVVKKKRFDPQLLTKFQKGFGLIFKGAEADDLVFVQSFYRGGSPTNLRLYHFVPLNVI